MGLVWFRKPQRITSTTNFCPLPRGCVEQSRQGSRVIQFGHTLLQETVYSGLLREDLVHIHKSIAERIEEEVGSLVEVRSD